MRSITHFADQILATRRTTDLVTASERNPVAPGLTLLLHELPARSDRAPVVAGGGAGSGLADELAEDAVATR
jgi:hypothetical protein